MKEPTTFKFTRFREKVKPNLKREVKPEIELEMYECDKCHKEYDITGIAMLAPENPSEECSPFIELQTICHECYIPF